MRDAGAAGRLSVLNSQLKNLKKDQKQLNDQWEAEKQNMTRLQNIKEEVDRVNIEIQQAEREYNLSRSAFRTTFLRRQQWRL